MFQEKRVVRLSETDATGVLYFTNLLKYAEEAFGGHLKKLGIDLGKLFAENDYLFPIVETRSKYFSPLFFGDEIFITHEILPLKRSSITLQTIFEKNEAKVGEVTITHVFTSKTTRKSIPIPDAFRNFFAFNESLMVTSSPQIS